MVKDSGIKLSLPFIDAHIRRRNHTSAMCVRWPLLAEMDWVSASISFNFRPINRCLQRHTTVLIPARNLSGVENVLTPARTRPTWRSTAKVMYRPFSTAAALLTIDAAHEPPLYSCPTCGKQFCRADSRDRHMRLHQNGTAGRKRVHGEVA